MTKAWKKRFRRKLRLTLKRYFKVYATKEELTKQLSNRDKRLRHAYNTSLDEYNRRLKKQGGGCAVCGRKAKEVALHVDHDHRINKVKRVVKKIRDAWRGSAIYKDKTFKVAGRTRKEVHDSLKMQLKRASVRGILCMPCNRGIRVFWDNPKTLIAAGKYLLKFKKGK